jgi:hypothetical protein
VLFQVMADAVAVGHFDLEGVTAALPPGYADQLLAWGRREGAVFPPAALALCALAWTTLHGTISLEMFGHLPSEVDPAVLFEFQMRDLFGRVYVPRGA